MRTTLAPVEAPAGERTACPAFNIEVDAERDEPCLTSRGDTVLGAVFDQHPSVDEGRANRHPEPASEVVIADPREVEPGRRLAFDRPHQLGRGAHSAQRLEEGRDFRTSQAVVAVAPLTFHAEEPASDEPGEVLAGGRGCDLRADLLTEDDTVYTYRPRTVLRRVLDHALDHLNQIEQWMRWRAEGIVPTPTDGWASSSDVLDEDFLPLSEADLAAWLWRIDVTWGMLAERAARLSPEELDWLPQENEWTIRRILHHVAGGFYTVWLDERLPDEPAERYAQASGRLLLRAHRALTAPSGPACTYYADGGLETTPEAVIRAVLECEYAALAAAQ